MFEIKKNHTNEGIDIYGQYNTYTFAFCGILWIKRTESSEQTWKQEAIEADKVFTLARKIFGPTDLYPRACEYLTDVFKKGDEGYYDGVEFMYPINSSQIKEFISILKGMKNTYKHIIRERIVIHSVSIPNNIIGLFKKYQPEYYKQHYNNRCIKNHVRKEPESEYDMYFEFFGCPEEDIEYIEDHIDDWFN